MKLRGNGKPNSDRAVIFSILAITFLSSTSITFYLFQTIPAHRPVFPSDPTDFRPSLPWATPWWRSTTFQRSLPALRFSDCPLCNFTATQIDPSSTERDVIITVAMGAIHGLPTTIRSIRTANIRAAVVILADSGAFESINSLIPDLVSDCGVIVIDIGSLTAHQMKGRYRTRWHLVYDYFRLNPHNFTRFVMTDAYDSFFQGDVFLKTVQSDFLYFSTESITVNSCKHNSAWIREIYPRSLKKFAPHPIVCAGPVVGGVSALLRFCEIMFGLKQWKAKWESPPDQAYVNYVVRTGMLEKAGVSYDVIDNDGFITTVGYCDRKAELMVDKNGNIGCPGFKNTPMLLHQYLRPKNMRPHMFAACPADDIEVAFKIDPYSKAKF
jgi:hypothetical protein